MNECAADDCERRAECKGWCRKHWERVKKHGDPYVVEHGGGLKPKKCGEPECDRKHHARGMCVKHYHHWLYAQRKPEADDTGNTECIVCGVEPMGGGFYCYEHFISEVVNKSPERPPIECGTQRGRERHRRRGEPYCGACERYDMAWFEWMAA